jgi:hypothetical protein
MLMQMKNIDKKGENGELGSGEEEGMAYVIVWIFNRRDGTLRVKQAIGRRVERVKREGSN